MSHSKYTGKSAPTVVDWGAMSTCGGWRKITIAEKGAPATESIDTTVAADASYAYTDDPLGGKGSASSTVTVEGFLSVTDFVDSGWTSMAIGSSQTVLVTKKASGDEWTASMVYKTFTTEAGIGTVVPFTATFENTTSAGTWSTDVP
jgi:hypothetical protein